MKTPHNRTRLWVDPPFQGRLLGRVSLYLLLYAVVVFHVGFLFQCLFVLAQGTVTKGVGELYGEYFWEQRALVIAFGLTLPVVGYDLLKFSHRLAGPLFRIRTMMADMAQGRPVTPFVARKGDLLAALIATFNGVIAAWNAPSGGDGGAASPVAEPATAEVVKS